MATLRDMILTSLRLAGARAYTSGLAAASAAASGLAAANARVDATALAMGRQLNSTYFNMGNMLHMVNRLALALGALATAGAYIGIKFEASMEQSQVAFKLLLGDVGKAKTMLADLFDLAAKTPFEFPQLVDASQKLLGFGMEADKVIPLLTKVGDAVAAVGADPERIDRITRALGQMQAKGKVYSEELLQMADAGLPAYKMLADGMKVTGEQLNSLLRKGQVSAQQGLTILADQMEKRYHGMAAEQAKTFNGLLSTIRDYSRMILGFAVRPLFDYLEKKVLPVVTQIETSIVKWGRSGGFERFQRNLSEAFKEGAGTKKRGLYTPDKQLGLAQKVGRVLGKVWKAISGYFKDLMAALAPAKPFWDNVLGPFLKGVVFGALAGVIGIFKLLIPVIKIFAIVLGWVGKKLAPLKKLFFYIGFIIGYIFGPGKIFGAAVKILGVFGKILKVVVWPLKILFKILGVYYKTQARIIWWILNKLAPAGSKLEGVFLAIMHAWDKVKGVVTAIAGFIKKYIGPIAAAVYQLGAEMAKKFWEGINKHGGWLIKLGYLFNPATAPFAIKSGLGGLFKGGGGGGPAPGPPGVMVNPSTGYAMRPPVTAQTGGNQRYKAGMVPGIGGFTVHTHVNLDGKEVAKSVSRHTADKAARR